MKTVAAVVRTLVPGLPWSRARELCRSGRVLVDGAPALDPAARVREGATVKLLFHVLGENQPQQEPR